MIIYITGYFLPSSNFHEGYAYVVDIGKEINSGKCIDTKGHTIIDFGDGKLVYSIDNAFSEGLCAVNYKGKYGYINTKGKLVIQPKFDYAYDFSEGLAVVIYKGSYCYIYKKRKYKNKRTL